MQIHRLTEMVFTLMGNERVTAKEFAERFEVSTRTVYRDIDILSGAGIPVLTDKGNGGGISISKEFRLDKVLLSKDEKQNLMTMLTAYHATLNDGATRNLLDKLSSIFHTSQNFIEVDFSDWNNDGSVQKTFDTLQTCIVRKRLARVIYCNANGEEQSRELEALKLIFKSRNWYLYAYCRKRQENRLFKLSRFRDVEILDEQYTRICEEQNVAQKLEWKGDVEEVTLKISQIVKNRLFDELPRDSFSRAENGDYLLTRKMPLDDWTIGIILSFGDRAEVVSPLWLKQKIRDIRRLAAER